MNPTEPPPGDKNPSPWTEPRLRLLVSLWHDRLSTALIARTLGPGFSRSAVVGKLFRMGLRRTGEQRHDAHVAGARHTRMVHWTAQAAADGRPPERPSIPLRPSAPCAVVPRLTGILDLRRSSCRWPYEFGEETRFCGHAAEGASPYCPDHHAIAYVARLPPLTLEAIEAATPRRRPGAPARLIV